MSSLKRSSAKALAGLLIFLTVTSIQARAQQARISVIIATRKPYTQLISRIQKLGGSVTRQYKYVNAIAADIPVDGLATLRDVVGSEAISHDVTVNAPKPARTSNRNAGMTAVGVYASATVGAGSRIFDSSLNPPPNAPADVAYSVNLKNLNVRAFHTTGTTGKGVTVAVIDSGTRPGYFSLDSDTSVIGGENLVPDGDSTFFSDPSNDPHGTFVASLISGNSRFFVPPTSTGFINSMDANFPGTLENTSTGRYLSVVGSAPEASIYAIRVFAANAGAPKSRIMAAMERVIELRDMYDQGIPGGQNIKICNLSFGTSTIDAGQTLFEQLIDQLFAKDIVPVVGDGDAGPSSLTISSPSTAFSALSIGATSPAANERLWRDLSGDFNALARPSSATQIASFSSRGPTADGRILPDVVAPGFGVLSQGCGGDDGFGTCIYNPASIDVASGTSFSGPLVSGIAALLRQKFPSASAGQIWNAIVSGADRSVVDGGTVLDEGHGVPNAMSSFGLLQSGKVGDQLPLPPTPDSSVENNIEINAGLTVFHGTVKQTFSNLQPGQRGEILYSVPPGTSQLRVDITNVIPALPPAQQNIFFGDDILLHIHSDKTSSGAFGDYFVIDSPFTDAFIVGDTSFVIPNPEPGIVRITLLGDTTNAGAISGDVMVTSTQNPISTASVSGVMLGGNSVSFAVGIPAGTLQAHFQLRWSADWSQYPTSDLDMYVFDPLGGVYADGATLNSPEDTLVITPTPGKWNILIQGFAIPAGKEKFDLSVILDGKTVPVK